MQRCTYLHHSSTGMDSMKRILEISRGKVQTPAKKSQSKDKIPFSYKKIFQAGQQHNEEHGQHSQEAHITVQAHSLDHDYAG